MSAKLAPWLAWPLWAVYVALAIPVVILQTANDSAGAPASRGLALANALFAALVLLVMMTVGALVASRRPENPIGWLFCCAALASGSGSLALDYAVYTLKTAPGALPAGVWVGLYGGWMRSVGFALLITFVPLLFPDGRLPSSRWRVAAWLCGAALVGETVALLVPDVFSNDDERLTAVRNPIGVIQNPVALGFVEAGSALLLLAGMAACAISVVVRFRHARGMERQQIKWFAYSAVMGLMIFAGVVVSTFLPGSLGAPASAFYLILVAPAIATGIAILRYRLFDIDLIINRTLVYGSLTALLAAVYFAAVASAQHVAQTLTGRADLPPVVIVASTLLIAALIMPLRRRIQAGIDRRFYRRKYDAARTLATFGATLCTETDLGALSAHLVAAVEETMRPAHASLWLRQWERASTGLTSAARRGAPLRPTSASEGGMTSASAGRVDGERE
ncbi:MAG TPA: hypothetical protein VIC85_14950 [Ktedonobacterales bacterium]